MSGQFTRHPCWIFAPCTDDKPVIKSEELRSLDSELGGVITDAVSLFEFAGTPASSLTLRNVAGTGGRFVTLVGLGPLDDASFTLTCPGLSSGGKHAYQWLGEAAAAAAKAIKGASAAVAVVGLPPADAAAVAGRVANGVVNGAYSPTRFKSTSNGSKLDTVELLLAGLFFLQCGAVPVLGGCMMWSWVVELS